MSSKTLTKVEIQRKESLKARSGAYSLNIKKLNIAISYGFYFEAVMIEYALIEDRIYSLLFHLGFTDFQCELRHNKNALTKKLLLCDNSRVRFIDISVRLKLLRKLCEMNFPLINDESERIYLAKISALFNEKRLGEDLMPLIEEISKWCKARNRIVHSLLTTNQETVKASLPGLSAEGLDLMRKMDKIVAKIKNFCA